MQINRKDYEEHYTALSDGALLEIKRDDLVPLAQECLDAEIGRRGLVEGPEEAMGAAATEPAEPSHEVPDMVVVGEYQDPGEADMARDLLRSAGIQAMLLNERLAGMLNIPLSPGTYHLLAATESEEEAVQILDSEISEEELAAQAEAAGDEPAEATPDEERAE
jgi:hypothetical protein